MADEECIKGAVEGAAKLLDTVTGEMVSKK